MVERIEFGLCRLALVVEGNHLFHGFACTLKVLFLKAANNAFLIVRNLFDSQHILLVS